MITDINQYRLRKKKEKLRHKLKMTGMCVVLAVVTLSVANIAVTNISDIMTHYSWEPAIILD
ncbi:hypothetical protein BEP19_02970 [Ammoniphilus oxalaticus]|uniref:Uncharacterized protein n=1 Tax=Ammoniphilus oxalaticus TaxID=66863 RepID=A0A419SNN3_9BACL|nr:hypothetical protein [Ammoniphilus oxalaticus]RKD25906.1 hypothetical protein BEP19_02970 [Ammoniphilus oxalaticus]